MGTQFMACSPAHPRMSSPGIHVSPSEVIYGGLALWLSLRELGFCVLSAEGQMADRGIVSSVMEISGEQRRCWTNGLLGDNGLCVFVRPPDWNSFPEQTGDPQTFELFVRSFGSWTGLAGRLVQQVRRWDDAERPAGDRLRIRAYPMDAASLPAPATPRRRMAQHGTRV